MLLGQVDGRKVCVDEEERWTMILLLIKIIIMGQLRARKVSNFIFCTNYCRK